MQRRSFVGLATAGLAGLAGCAGVLSDSDDSDDDGPDGAARNFLEAAFDGDVEGTNAYLHSDAEIEPFGQEYAEEYQRVDARVESVEVVEQSGDTATVSVTASAQRPGGSERQSTTVRVELRREDGEWRVYDGSTGESESESVGPSVRWDATSHDDADDSVTAVEFVHIAGDTIQSGTLSARVSGNSASAPSGTEITVGAGVVVPLEGAGNSLPESTEIELVWSDPDGDSSQILTTYALERPSVGTLGEQLRIDEWRSSSATVDPSANAETASTTGVI